MKRFLFLFLVALIVFMLPVPHTLVPGTFSTVQAQSYYFNLKEQIVDIYYNADGTASIDYLFLFVNNPGASPIEYVDVGLPNGSFDDASISADVAGKSLSDISRSGYQGDGGSGVAVGLGSLAIKPGQSGRVHVFIGVQRRMLYEGDEEGYASTQFSPTWFGSEYVYGKTNLVVSFHLPPGVSPSEPRYFGSPNGWSEPAKNLDDQGRVTYTWSNPDASGSRQYTFGAAFPMRVVPESAIIRQSGFEKLLAAIGMTSDDFFGLMMCLCPISFFVALVVIGVRSSQKRMLQYLPPKISIEGLGIKRGLTAVEAAILLEAPLDKVLTMILFSVLKKGAARVTKEDPLTLEVSDPLPEDLRGYEIKFLEAFKTPPSGRRKLLRDLIIELVNSVSAQLKGFSRKETIAYYQDIMRRAWTQVEEAATPEVRMEKYSEYMEWTMLDKDYDYRTRNVFSRDPVIVTPSWWWRYRPVGMGGGQPATTGGRPSGSPSTSGGGLSTPNLPGSSFAASIVTGVQNFSRGVVGNVQEFTSGITTRTNPLPVSSSSGLKSSGRSGGGGGRSGGGCACACACACAGCACACAGGGR